VSPNLERIIVKARANPDLVFTSLYHHIVPPEQLQPCRLPVPSHLSVRALRYESAACRRHAALASRWRGACGLTPGAGSNGQNGSRVAGGGRTQSVAKAV
jgi:hypothetical protein